MKTVCRYIAIILGLVISKTLIAQPVVTTGTLLREMIDFDRLTLSSEVPYQSIQYSSYDRRSVSPDAPGWFANSDGFGREAIPGFEKVLKEPGGDGIGEYLMCDVNGPGAIVRLWTANISGKVKLLIDGQEIFHGNAEKFFWDFPNEFSAEPIPVAGTFRQFDALYFPIAFSKSCRLEWTGRLTDIHFYHIGMRLYSKEVKVRSFRPGDLKLYCADIDRIDETMRKPDKIALSEGTRDERILTVPVKTKGELIRLEGAKAIRELSIKVHTNNPEIILRQTLLRIYFDGSSIPQVESPVGDFFGAAPGINPFVSLPFSVKEDSTLVCRFVMPFRESAVIQIENQSALPVSLNASVVSGEYAWKDGVSFHFRARWRISRGLSTADVRDVPYLVALGSGRVVGAVCYLMNPSDVPTASGNWWGEGDEKIFADNQRFPSFYGTGSEDYYNYSWSSDEIFSYAYCGQPRNDGPATRGFISNFRWHIADDILFGNSLAFYMELLSHGKVNNFVYARMVYLYAMPGLKDDHFTITGDDIREIEVPQWNPVSFRASMGYGFVGAEYILKDWNDVAYQYNPLWEEGKLIVWTPSKHGEKINFSVNRKTAVRDNMAISFGRMPLSGTVRVYVNNQLVKLKTDRYHRTELMEQTDLNESGRVLNRTYITDDIDFKQGENIITIENVSPEGCKANIGIDMFWIKY
jgi:hypothetical protein